MPPKTEKSSQLKRARASVGEGAEDPSKKPRRSQRLSAQHDDEHLKKGPLPSPVTHKDTASTESAAQRTVSPAPQSPRQHTPVSTSPKSSPPRQSGLSSPPDDTQPFSQYLPPAPYSYEVEDEEGEGVWGYLIPLDAKGGNDALVLRRRAACPVPPSEVGRTDGRSKVGKTEYKDQEEGYEEDKADHGTPAGGYLIGRHPECDRILNVPTISNRHCLLFNENKHGDSIAMLEDLSGNGTYINDAYVGRNKRRELQDGDEISILDQARFTFRYPRNRDANGFRQQYIIHSQLGKGHFATVYLCTEKCSGMRYAVKKFEKRVVRGPHGPTEDKSRVDGLQQEIAVLMGISHPNLMCLKDTFDEYDGVYLVLELAPEGELFNHIVSKHRLSEAETRKIFVQLFQGVKYLHERNIVHRDIKPENILLIDKDLSIKIADFGLAKIIGEESFTATLCGTPSYVAPEILESGNRRRYTRAVDVWSLGVVLYICLCGFPPFSDELYSRENPYTLSQQIKMGRFDYPSPYWDSVGDPALDLIDRMLTVDVDKRYTIDQCLEHPWTTNRAGDAAINPGDSLDGLTPKMDNLDFSRRKPVRERTMLSAINDVRVTRVINTQKDDLPALKVWEKNNSKAEKQSPINGVGDKQVNGHAATTGKEVDPAHNRDLREFAAMGGKGDQPLFGDDGGSNYLDGSMRAP